jgi:hypothetical protein
MYIHQKEAANWLEERYEIQMKWCASSFQDKPMTLGIVHTIINTKLRLRISSIT